MTRRLEAERADEESPRPASVIWTGLLRRLSRATKNLMKNRLPLHSCVACVQDVKTIIVADEGESP
jgi:hypothetical protein